MDVSRRSILGMAFAAVGLAGSALAALSVIGSASAQDSHTDKGGGHTDKGGGHTDKGGGGHAEGAGQHRYRVRAGAGHGRGTGGHHDEPGSDTDEFGLPAWSVRGGGGAPHGYVTDGPGGWTLTDKILGR